MKKRYLSLIALTLLLTLSTPSHAFSLGLSDFTGYLTGKSAKDCKEGSSFSVYSATYLKEILNEAVEEADFCDAWEISDALRSKDSSENWDLLAISYLAESGDIEQLVAYGLPLIYKSRSSQEIQRLIIKTMVEHELSLNNERDASWTRTLLGQNEENSLLSLKSYLSRYPEDSEALEWLDEVAHKYIERELIILKQYFKRKEYNAVRTRTSSILNNNLFTDTEGLIHLVAYKVESDRLFVEKQLPSWKELKPTNRFYFLIMDQGIGSEEEYDAYKATILQEASDLEAAYQL